MDRTEDMNNEIIKNNVKKYIASKQKQVAIVNSAGEKVNNTSEIVDHILQTMVIGEKDLIVNKYIHRFMSEIIEDIKDEIDEKVREHVDKAENYFDVKIKDSSDSYEIHKVLTTRMLEEVRKDFITNLKRLLY